MFDPRASRTMFNPATIPFGVTASAINDDFFLGGDDDFIRSLSDVEFGKRIEVVFERFDVNVATGGDEFHACFVGKHAHGFDRAHKEAFVGDHAGVVATGHRKVLTRVQVHALRRGGFYPRRRCNKPMSSFV